jgi:uncharacterized OB-fold protein
MSADTPETKVRAVFDGPIEINGTTWSKRLKGSRCEECGTVTLIARPVCPGCWKSNTQKAVDLSDHGILYSYTIVRHPPPGMTGPYAIAYVDLPEKIRLMVRAGADITDDLIGGEVAIDVGRIGTDEDGTIIVGPTLAAAGGNGEAA